MQNLFVQFDSELGKKVLYEPAERVAGISSPKIQILLREMQQKMRGAGIGLAANQIGHPLQIFMIEYVPMPQSPSYTDRYQLVFEPVPFQIFINPRIVKASTENMSFWHGCLSAFGKKRGLLATYSWIEYEAFNGHGEKVRGRLDQLAAVIFQHEFRHLLGSLYIDHAKIFREHEELLELFRKGELKAFDQADPSTPHLLAEYVVGESIEEYKERRMVAAR